jgi:hypothetical protein
MFGVRLDVVLVWWRFDWLQREETGFMYHVEIIKIITSLSNKEEREFNLRTATIICFHQVQTPKYRLQLSADFISTPSDHSFGHISNPSDFHQDQSGLARPTSCSGVIRFNISCRNYWDT